MEMQERPTVGELAASSLAAVNVFEKYGIDYCCAGKRPLEDVCFEKGLAADSLVEEIGAAINAPTNAATDWNTAPLRVLINHIVTKHHAYLKLELPRVGLRLRRVVEVHGAKDQAMLSKLETVYTGMWQELDQHMRKEEMMLFPAIARYEKALEDGLPIPPAPFGTIANPIGVMEAEHASAGAALRRMQELTHGYTAPAYACATYRALLEGLKSLEADLHQHIHLENNILFPRVVAIERRSRFETQVR
jgi:regulator of cell morphogenesis and NO signaling